MIIASANRLRTVDENYFSVKQREIAALNTSGPPVIDLGTGGPDLPPSPTTIAELARTAARATSHGYQGNRGTDRLRQAIADWYWRCYRTVLEPTDEVLPLLGANAGIFHIAMAFLDPGDEVLIPDPGDPAYGAVTRLIGAVPRTYDLSAATGWQVDVEALAAMDLRRVKQMWINYPHMPTGARACPTTFARLVALARARGFLLVNDNSDSAILNEQPLSLLASTDAWEVALELNSLSNSHHMAGWQVGWVAGRSDYLDSILKVQSQLDSGIFLAIQEAAVAALSNPPSWHEQRNREYRLRGEYAWRLLNLLGCTYNRGQVGLFKWGALPAGSADAEVISDRLLHEARVFVTPGTVFGHNGRGHLRVSLCASSAQLQAASERIARWQQQAAAAHQPPNAVRHSTPGTGLASVRRRLRTAADRLRLGVG